MTVRSNTTPLAEFAGAIPAQAAGTKVHYYVHAEATSGKTGARPMPAPEGWWSFRVLGNVDGLDTPDASSPWRALYPNPAKAITCLEFELPTSTPCAVTLTNAMGQTVETLHQGTLARGTQRVFLDASTLASGPYLVTLTTDAGRRWSKRLLVEE